MATGGSPPSKVTWKVHKFGGTSLADAECFRRVGRLVSSQPERPVAVVVSAMGGLTDILVRLLAQAETGDSDFADHVQAMANRYELAAASLLDPSARGLVLDEFHGDLKSLQDVLRAIVLVRSAPQRSWDLITGFGELWSARLLGAYLESDWLDARKVLRIRQTKLGPSVLWESSRTQLATEVAADYSGILVITGYIATDENGLQSTLGRNGSDYSASIFAALLGADLLTIWTDVDGVLSGDPRRVPEAEVIKSISYNEAMELAYFGAKVIHPQTMGPCIDHDIPILIRNTFAPERPGTQVLKVSESDQGIKGITSIDGIALINVEGAGMIGVPGTADRLFGALHRSDVSVILISQASSEHSICFAVPDESAEAARAAVADAFATELAEGQIQKVEATRDCSIVAVVGDNMNGTPGIAGRFLNTIGRAGINVSAIAQGSSERNISAVVNRADSTRALRAVHSGFYLSAKTISIGVVGAGTVGGTFLDQLADQSRRLRDDFNLDLRIRAIASSKKMLLGTTRVALGNWREQFAGTNSETSLDQLIDHIDADHLPHTVLIDCTAEQAVANRYADWLRRGIHIITPNKKAFSADLEYYLDLQAAAREGSSHYLYETTVGAGLPVIQTLRDLRETGDRVDRVEGIFSGTLAYLFNTFDGSQPFSAIVAEARERGFTEPDPREDLSGMDVARKVTILARELGWPQDVSSLEVHSLVPEVLREGTVDEFMQRLPDFDDEMQKMFEHARAGGRHLRYIGSLDARDGASVRLTEVDGDHPFAKINLTDNVVQFVTSRYAANPLVVQGPGAGPEVTAGGVFADLLRLSTFLRAGD